jgi:hypothetical protein
MVREENYIIGERCLATLSAGDVLVGGRMMMVMAD